MGDRYDLFWLIEWIGENPTEAQLWCMLGIVLTVIVCGWGLFVMGNGNFLWGGLVALTVFVGVIVICQRIEPS